MAPKRKKQSKAAREARPLDELARALRRSAQAMIGDGCSGASRRLTRAALPLRAVGEAFPDLVRVADELDAAATALDQGLPVEGFTEFDELLQVPTARDLKFPVPQDQRGNLSLLRDLGNDARNALGRFEGATWLAAVGPDRARDVVAVATGDPQVAFDVATLAPRACFLGDVALADAGLALIGVAHQLEILTGLLAFLGLCTDDCTKGATRNCTATDVTFAPFGDSDTDSADFKNALNFLKVLGYALPGKVLSPGGKGLIKEIVKQLDDLKKKVDKLKKDLDGYAVFVRLTYEECVDGLCGTYWKEKTKVVEIAPPAGKKHQIGKGWKQSVIDKLGQDEQETARQLKQFRDLAEAQCP